MCDNTFKMSNDGIVLLFLVYFSVSARAFNTRLRIILGIVYPRIALMYSVFEL